MNRDVKQGALGAAAGIAGLVVCLTAAEVLDAKWLYAVAIAFLFTALLAGELAVLGRRGLGVLAGVLALVVLAAVVAERA